jgi:hypothetical protein
MSESGFGGDGRRLYIFQQKTRLLRLRGAVCKCGTHKALDFSTLWFGTRRSKVQMLSARPLFPLSIQQVTLRFQHRLLLRFYVQYVQHRWFWTEVQNPRPPAACSKRNAMTPVTQWMASDAPLYDVLVHLAIPVSDGLIFMSHPKSFQVSMDAILSEPCKTVAAESMKVCFGLLQFLQGRMQSTPQEIRLREKTPLPVLKEKAGRAFSDRHFEQCRQLGAEINVPTSGICLEKQF